jgi:hypothetical protein
MVYANSAAYPTLAVIQEFGSNSGPGTFTTYPIWSAAS